MTRSSALSSQRRPLMKALGTGAALSMLSGSAVAQQDDSEGTDGKTDDSEGTVHTVETRIAGPSTNPDRPADFFYQPTGLHVQPGDVVKFVFRTPDHNVVSYHPAFGMRRRVPTGVTAFSSPLLGWRPESIPGDQIEPPGEMGGPGEDESDGEDDREGDPDEAGDDGGNGDETDEGPVPDMWLHAFERPGVYDLLCSPHESFGMAMRVVVGDTTEASFETANPENLPGPRAGPVGLARATLTDPELQPSNIVDRGTVPWETLEVNRNGDGNGEEPS